MLEDEREHGTACKHPLPTIVAAWIKALTGVGPSMASGSQTCKRKLRRFPNRTAKDQQARDGRPMPQSIAIVLQDLSRVRQS